ncbi:MAG: imidazolonepropionase [Sandaracinus sp.]
MVAVGEPALLIRGARIARCDGSGAEASERLAVLDDGAVAVSGDGRVVYVGRTADAPTPGASTEIVYARGALLTPGLVDAHTHLVFAGRRTHEHELKMRGADYRAIAAAGGGIVSTVRATRAASDEALSAALDRRLEIALGYGVTTVEVKSGYGLSVEEELRLLRIAARSGKGARAPLPRTVPTLLGAHAVPEEHRADRSVYVDLVAREMMPRAAREGHAVAADVYLDEGAFSRAEAAQILEAAKASGLAVKAHVGQFRDLGGAELVASLGGLSCDHLEQVSDAGLAAMAATGTVAVLLPVAWRTLRQAAPDAARMRGAGVSVAVATDTNPGTSATLDLPMCAALAVRDAGLDPSEALLSITASAARALGRPDAGRVRVGAPADLALWDHDDPAMFAYVMGGQRPTRVWIEGRTVLDVPAATSAF